MRILVFAEQSGLRSDGGLESLTLLLAGLKDRFEISVATDREGPFSERWRRLGLDVALSGQGRWKRSLGFASLARRVAPDLIHCNDIASCLCALPHAPWLRAPILFNVRNVKSPGGAYDLRWRLARSRVQAMVALSSEMAESLDSRIPPVSWAGSAPPVHAISSIVDLDRMRPSKDEAARGRVRKKLGLPTDERRVVVYVAAVTPRKQQRLLLDHAHALLEAAGPGSLLRFVGDIDHRPGSYGAECLAEVQRARLTERVAFVGATEDVVSWYQAADMSLVASEREGLARCMIESLACGLPVVSFAVCSARETLETSGAGIVVPRNDFPGLVRAVATLAAESPDAAEWRRRAARTVAEDRFGAGPVVDAYARLYAELGR